jgi:hypothetical protein
MKVWHMMYEYTLYVGADGLWVMHAFSHMNGHSEWRSSHQDVSNVNPFKPYRSSSRVEYDAWR